MSNTKFYIAALKVGEKFHPKTAAKIWWKEGTQFLADVGDDRRYFVHNCREGGVPMQEATFDAKYTIVREVTREEFSDYRDELPEGFKGAFVWSGYKFGN